MSDLAYKRTNVYEKADESTMKAIFDYAEGYRKFIDGAKTEREACAFVEKAAKKQGYKPFAFGKKLKPGDKVLLNDGLMIFGAQGTFDLLGFRPEIKQFLIRQVFDLNIERRFIGGSETSGHTCSLSEAEARKRPVPTTICALSVLTDYKDKWGEWQASLRKSPAPLGRRTEMQAQDGPLFC